MPGIPGKSHCFISLVGLLIILTHASRLAGNNTYTLDEWQGDGGAQIQPDVRGGVHQVLGPEGLLMSRSLAGYRWVWDSSPLPVLT